jgi:Ribbon-helix-helix protein, copG family
MKQNKMNRTQIYFTEKEHQLIKAEAEEKGLPMSDVIRRIIDEYYDKKRIIQNA